MHTCVHVRRAQESHERMEVRTQKHTGGCDAAGDQRHIPGLRDFRTRGAATPSEPPTPAMNRAATRRGCSTHRLHLSLGRSRH